MAGSRWRRRILATHAGRLEQYESREVRSALRSGTGRGRLMEARRQIADFLSALLTVYSLCIVAWIVASFLFSLGGRVPYNRVLSAVLDFLRDVSEPFLRIFRRLGLRAGPIDFSPIVALVVLGFVGKLVIAAIAP